MTNPPDRFTTAPDPAQAGQDIEICFANSALAGTTVTIQIDNGDGDTDSVDITLDAIGHGCVSWPVPAMGWDSIALNQPTSHEHVTPVV